MGTNAWSRRHGQKCQHAESYLFKCAMTDVLI
jgi:hypothetical protein